jgi:hypothetical protein
VTQQTGYGQAPHVPVERVGGQAYDEDLYFPKSPFYALRKGDTFVFQLEEESPMVVVGDGRLKHSYPLRKEGHRKFFFFDVGQDKSNYPRDQGGRVHREGATKQFAFQGELQPIRKEGDLFRTANFQQNANPQDGSPRSVGLPPFRRQRCNEELSVVKELFKGGHHFFTKNAVVGLIELFCFSSKQSIKF